MPHRFDDLDDDREEPRPAGMDSLSPEMEPPAALEERVLRTLRDQGLVRAIVPARPRDRLRPVAVAVSLVLALALGFAGGRLIPGAAGAPSPDYILLVRPGPGEITPVGDEEAMRRFGEYSRWYRDVAARGRMVGGEKLVDDGGFVLSGDGVAPLPTAMSATGAVEGYFLIRAADDAEAERIASTCPHLKYGGVLEVRRIDRPEGTS
ncbi:MAG: hypothetical protein PVF68_05405 [Acidobacteriota bacterium]|jgi:hypothetical protein